MTYEDGTQDTFKISEDLKPPLEYVAYTYRQNRVFLRYKGSKAVKHVTLDTAQLGQAYLGALRVQFLTCGNSYDMLLEEYGEEFPHLEVQSKVRIGSGIALSPPSSYPFKGDSLIVITSSQVTVGLVQNWQRVN